MLKYLENCLSGMKILAKGKVTLFFNKLEQNKLSGLVYAHFVSNGTFKNARRLYLVYPDGTKHRLDVHVDHPIVAGDSIRFPITEIP